MKRALLASLLLAACGSSDPAQLGLEYEPDMGYSVPYDAFAPNPNTRDGKTLLAPAPFTIPRGYTPFHYGPGPKEAERAGRELANPLSPTEENLARGERVFQTRCYVCHGRGGQGDGPVVPPFPTPPQLTAPHARALPDGRIYHIITTGQGLMPSHAAQVLPLDRWRVVLYLRKLQGVLPTAKGTP